LQQVQTIRRAEQGLSVTQKVVGGSHEVEVQGPLVAAIATDAASARVPGMKDILTASRKPFEQLQLATLARTPVTLAVAASSRPAGKARKNEIFRGDDAAQRLVVALRADGSL
jgi:electron transfer flavoprotein beta subunit